jgi:type VI secretion system secreted protein VgrG
VAGFKGREALSELYHLSIGVLTHGEEIDLDQARGLSATFTIDAGDGRTLPIHGMIARAALRHAWAGQALYELVVVPKVWALTLTHYSRVFVDKSVVDILEELLVDSGISTEDYELRLQAEHPARHHTCQYKESRWAFLSRLMERDGLYYFFEQGEAREKLIITDHRSCHRPLLDAPVRYVPLSGTGDAISSEALGMLTIEAICVPSAVRLRDHDYLRPTLDVRAEVAAGSGSEATQVHHGEHDFRSAEAGEPLALVEAEAWQTRQQQLRGRGRVFGLRPGYRFRVEEHPLDSLNCE